MIEKAWFSKSRRFFRYHRSNARELQRDDDIIRYTDSYEVQEQPSKSKFQHLAQKLSRTSSIGNASSASSQPHKNMKSEDMAGNGLDDVSEVKSNPWLADKPYRSFSSTPSKPSQGNGESIQSNPGNESIPEERGECDVKSNDSIDVDGGVEDAPEVTRDGADALSTDCIDSNAANLTYLPTNCGPYNSAIILSQSTLTDDEEISADKMSLNQSVTQIMERWEVHPVHDETGYEVVDSRTELCVGEVVETEGTPVVGPQYDPVAKNDVNENSVTSVRGAQLPPESGFVGKVADGAKKNMLHVYGSCVGCTAAVADRVLDDETNEVTSNITLDSALNSMVGNSVTSLDEQVHDVLMSVGGCLYKWLPEPGERAMDIGASMLDLAVDISKAKFL